MTDPRRRRWVKESDPREIRSGTERRQKTEGDEPEGWRLEVATRTTPRLYRWVNSLCRIIASAMSVTWNFPSLSPLLLSLTDRKRKRKKEIEIEIERIEMERRIEIKRRNIPRRSRGARIQRRSVWRQGEWDLSPRTPWRLCSSSTRGSLQQVSVDHGDQRRGSRRRTNSRGCGA